MSGYYWQIELIRQSKMEIIHIYSPLMGYKPALNSLSGCQHIYTKISTYEIENCFLETEA